MIAFLLLLVGSIAQPLDSVQYGALWGVLDGLGSSFFSFFFFRFLR